MAPYVDNIWYLTQALGKQLACDLQIIQLFAEFYHDLTRSLAEAISNIDLAKLEKAVTLFNDPETEEQQQQPAEQTPAVTAEAATTVETSRCLFLVTICV